MRICLYSETVLPKLGGQELVVDALARHLQDRGHSVVVLAPRPRRRWRVDDGALPYRVVRHPRFFSTHRFVGWYRWWLERLYRASPFDLLHTHSVYPCGWIASLCGSRLPVPRVITSHGGDVRAGNVRLQKSGLAARHTAAVQAADALVAISRFTSDGFLRLGGRAEQIVTIPNGVDLRPFAEREVHPARLDPRLSETPYVLFLGRLHQRKGVDLLLDALARCQHRTIRVVIAGDGDERPALEAQAARLGLDQRATFVGRVAGGLKTSLLQHAAAVVIPSRDWEAYPLVVLEAYAAGRGVVATRIPGLGDLIEPGTTGTLVDPERADLLAAALDDIGNRPDHWAACGRSGRERAEAASWPRVAELHEALYARLIETRGQRSAA